jgi:hypothetical protein
MRLLILLAGLLNTSPALAAKSLAQSGPATAALVELYTSEGCSSCPPADRWLSSLGKRGYPPGKVVPIALHVDYWDYIGWKDPYAKREFSLRQRKLSQLQKMALVYTPQVVLQGRDFREWSGKAFDDAIARITAQPARARMALEIVALKSDALEVAASAELLAPNEGDPALYLAAYRNGLQSKVTAGENRGRLLAHDHVVLEWQGPFPFANGRSAERRTLPLLPGARAGDSGVAAFVQNRSNGEVLQALMLPGC